MSKPISAAERRRILALPSPLQRETREILLGDCRERVIPERSAEDAQDFRELRAWLDRQPHVAWCRCGECARKEVA